MKKTSVVTLIITLIIAIFVIGREYKALKKDLASAKSSVVNIHNAISYKSLPVEKLGKLDFIDENTISAGEKEMKTHKVVFTGISRDNASELSFVMRHIEFTGEFFADYRVIIFENDSV